MLELVELRQESVHDLEGTVMGQAGLPLGDQGVGRTRRASDGSLPDIAPARAAVKLSTSSAGFERQESWSARQEGKFVLTDEDHHKRPFFLDEFRDLGEKALDELARLGEPL